MICPPGEYCSHSSLTAPNGSCLPGFYCTNASTEANPDAEAYGDECPVGHFCPEHSYEPTPCPSGSYQPFVRQTNESACVPCDPGKYCLLPGQAAVTGDCTAGYFCVLGASSPAPLDGITGDICPAGSHCPAGSPFHIACVNGSYTNHTGAAACYDCPAGFFCVSRDDAQPCLPGYYCPVSSVGLFCLFTQDTNLLDHY